MVVTQFQQIGYKAEATELTAETLVAAQFATAWASGAIVPEDGYNARRPRRATFAPLQGVGGTAIGKFTGQLEPRPSGTDGTAPDWYALLAAAGATVTTDVATFGAESTASAVLGTSCTIKHRDGAYERTMAGTRISKLTFSAEKGGTWKCDVEGTGRYTQAAQTAFVAAAHPSAGLAHPFLGMTCTIGSFTGSINSASISIENTVTPTPDATNASGFGRNIITAQSLKFMASLIEDGSFDWRGAYRNDATGDRLAITLQMSAGAAGNVLTWTGTMHLIEQPTIEDVDGIGYVSISGEFDTSSASAALTLTQS